MAAIHAAEAIIVVAATFGLIGGSLGTYFGFSKASEVPATEDGAHERSPHRVDLRDRRAPESEKAPQVNLEAGTHTVHDQPARQTDTRGRS